MELAKLMIIIVIILTIFIIACCLFGILRWYTNKIDHDTQHMVGNHIFNDIYNRRMIDSSIIKVKNTPQYIFEGHTEIIKEQLPIPKNKGNNRIIMV